MPDAKKIAANIRKLEERLLQRATLKESVAKSRIIAQDAFRFEAGTVRLTIMLKEIQLRPQFFTVKFDLPASKSFIFTSYDRSGKRLFNRQKFREMMHFLSGSGAAEDFERLLADKVRAETP
jgi:hypothetical protein